MKQYPDCGYLGSDVAELQAFAAHLKQRTALVDDGHTAECAALMSGTEAGCSCDKRFEKGSSRNG